MESLEEKHYQTKMRGERTQPVSRCLAEGKYLIIEHHGHTHFCYQITKPTELKKEQMEFNLQKEDDYLISVKNPQQPSPPGTGLGQKVNYSAKVQEKFASYRFINLTERYEGLRACWEKIPTDDLVKEFATVSPEAVSSLK